MKIKIDCVLAHRSVDRGMMTIMTTWVMKVRRNRLRRGVRRVRGEEEGEGGVKQLLSVSKRSEWGRDHMFKIKKSTRMMKVFATYAARKGVEATALRFMLDGDVRFFCCANL